MERKSISNKPYLIGYHTQEYRSTAHALEEPIKCKGKTAWLGVGYYFWTEIEFAHYWGEDFKKRATGYYDIYKANINVEKCLNTVFDEEGYFFFKTKIEETIEYFKQKNMYVTLEQVHKFLADNIWNDIGVECIMYDDKPVNSFKSDRIYSEIPDLYFKKRIQIVVFNLKNVINFVLYLEEQQYNA